MRSIDEAEARRFLALAACRLRGWSRARSPWLWLLLFAAWIWWDWRAPPPGHGADVWLGAIQMGALLGFLAGYDGFAGYREDGSLRLVLLHPVRRGTVALSFLAAAGVASSLFLVAGALYLTLAGAPPPPSGRAGATGIAIFGALAFASYAQAASLVLGRDASAVAGLAVLLLGAGPAERLVPPTAPAWVGPMVEGVFWLLPTTHRLDRLALGRGEPAGALLALSQVVLVLGGTAWMLGRVGRGAR